MIEPNEPTRPPTTPLENDNVSNNHRLGRSVLIGVASIGTMATIGLGLNAVDLIVNQPSQKDMINELTFLTACLGGISAYGAFSAVRRD